jgi:hypothetical protein
VCGSSSANDPLRKSVRSSHDSNRNINLLERE